jgi:hypothetical protein
MTTALGNDHAPARRMILRLRAEDLLALAASPTFALMALLDATVAVDPAAMICASAGLSPMHGMLTMYLLMSLFHLRPWLQLVRSHRPGGTD